MTDSRPLPRLAAALVALLGLVAPAFAKGEEPLRPVVEPHTMPLPVADASAQDLLAERPGEGVHCTVNVLVDEFGQVRDAWPQGCPRALRDAAIQAVRTWQYHPPTLGGRAVSGRDSVEFVFVSNSVAVKTKLPKGAVLVRTGPTAYPLWPSPPEPSRKGQRFLRESAPGGYTCKVAFEVDKLGLPEKMLVEDCPSPLHERVLRRAYRFGFRVENAQPGDGTVYHMALWMAADA